MRAMTDVDIRLYRKGDEHHIVRLFQEVYGKPLTVEQWRWKYLGQGNLRVWAALAFNNKGELVAHYGGLPVRMFFRGRHITACQCVDAMVKKGYRANDLGIAQTESIFYRLGNLIYDTFGTFFYAFPGDVYYNWGRKTGHIEECLTVPEYRLNCDGNLRSSSLYRLRVIGWDDSRVDELWRKVEKDIGWAMVRDREFIDWRYNRNPFYKHVVYGLEHIISKKLHGWAVVRDDGEDWRIMDAVFISTCMETLLAKVAAAGSGMNKKQIKIWLPDVFKQRLQAAGFNSYDIHTWMPNFIRFKTADTEEIRDNFYYTMGDTDFL
jgi:hypothetical protein